MPPAICATLRSPMEIFALTALWSTAVSEARRLVSSPVRRRSKKPISWSRMPEKSRSRMRVTARSPASEIRVKRADTATACSNATRTMNSAARSTCAGLPPPRMPSMMMRMPCG